MARYLGKSSRFPRVAGVVVAAAASLVGCAAGGSTAQPAPRTSSPTAAPLLLGYANTEGKGALSFPSFTQGVKVAVDRVNADGGVKGHPIALESCLNDGTPASSVACANTFVQKKVPLVLDGVDAGVDAMVPVLEGAKTTALAMTFQAPKAAASPSFVQLAPPLDASIVVPMTVFAKDGAKTMSFVATDVPQIHTAFAQSIKPVAAKLGMEATLVTYNPGSPDFQAVAATLKATKVDAAFFSGPEQMCNSFVTAVSSVGYSGKVNMGVCSQFFAKSPQQSAGFRAIGFVYPAKAVNSAPAGPKKDIEEYIADMNAAHQQALVDDVAALWGYSLVRTAALMLEKAPENPTAESVSATMTSLRDVAVFSGGTVTCAGRPAEVGAACSKGVLVFEGKPDGSLKVIGDGFTQVG